MHPHGADLYTHTYYSDGRASPTELLEYAAQLGFTTLAITDHDNARGAREALPIAKRLDVRLIPAVEFTCRWDACGMPSEESDVDVLGYFVDLESPAFRQAEEAALADFSRRIEAWRAALAAAGYAVTFQDMLAYNPRYVSYIELYRVLVAQGYCSDFQAAQRLVQTYAKAKPVCARTIDRTIADIHAAGGAAVLAHPSTRYLCWQGNGLLDAAGLRSLVEMGLDGVEVYHPTLDAAARAHFLDLAGRFELAVTGGSDEHAWPSGFPHLGREMITEDMVEALARRAKNYQTG
jgi:predicted metal-dependent phosphoesterase TrpH